MLKAMSTEDTICHSDSMIFKELNSDKANFLFGKGK